MVPPIYISTYIQHVSGDARDTLLQKKLGAMVFDTVPVF